MMISKIFQDWTRYRLLEKSNKLLPNLKGKSHKMQHNTITRPCHKRPYKTIHNAMLSRMRPHMTMAVKSNKTIRGQIRPFIQGHIRPNKANTAIQYYNVPHNTLLHCTVVEFIREGVTKLFQKD